MLEDLQMCPAPGETAENFLDGLSWHLSPSRAVTDSHCMELALCLFFSQKVKGYTRGEITELLNFSKLTVHDYTPRKWDGRKTLHIQQHFADVRKCGMVWTCLETAELGEFVYFKNKAHVFLGQTFRSL